LILVQLEHILVLGCVSIQLLRPVFVRVVGRNLARIVKNNNVQLIDAVLYQEVVHWHVLLGLVKVMQKILVLDGLVLHRMEVLVDIGDI
jgi:hypothetical protein